MKKFSRSRRTAAAGLVAVAAVTLAACHPPHEQPSDEKVANASTYTGEPKPGAESEGASEAPASTEKETETAEAAAEDGQPRFQDCVAAPTVEPHVVTLDCADDVNRLEDINWEAWDENGAHGTGTRVTVDGDQERRVSDVDVELRNPADTAEGFTFTEIIVDGQPVEQ